MERGPRLAEAEEEEEEEEEESGEGEEEEERDGWLTAAGPIQGNKERWTTSLWKR